MRKEYDFSDSVRNPYAKRLKKQITLRVNQDAIAYFKALAQETGIPYQNLINLYLTECAHSGKKLTLQWASQDRGRTSRSSGRARRAPLTGAATQQAATRPGRA